MTDLPSGLWVMSAPCSHCLFTPDRLVSKERAAQIITDLDDTDGHFCCHLGTIRGQHIVCAGDYRRDPGRTNSMRIAGRLGAITRVPVEEYEKDTVSDHPLTSFNDQHPPSVNQRP